MTFEAVSKQATVQLVPAKGEDTVGFALRIATYSRLAQPLKVLLREVTA